MVQTVLVLLFKVQVKHLVMVAVVSVHRYLCMGEYMFLGVSSSMTHTDWGETNKSKAGELQAEKFGRKQLWLLVSMPR